MPSDEEEAAAHVLPLPDISSLDHFSRSQPLAWRVFLHGHGPKQAAQFLDRWTRAGVHLTLDNMPEAALLATLELSSTCPTSLGLLLPPLSRFLKRCAYLLEGHAKYLQQDRQLLCHPPRVTHSPPPSARSLLVAAFVCTQTLLLQPEALAQPAPKQEAFLALQAAKSAGVQALCSCCLLVHLLLGAQHFQEAHPRIGQVRAWLPGFFQDAANLL